MEFSAGGHVGFHLQSHRSLSLAARRTARPTVEGSSPCDLSTLRVNAPTLPTLTLNLVETTAGRAARNKDGRHIDLVLIGAGTQKRSQDLENKREKWGARVQVLVFGVQSGPGDAGELRF